MNFTRDPIIETIITPKDGYKLHLRTSKGGGEEFSVDAVEVVSFGQSIFYRSFERPKAFLLPVNDYELVEVRESKVVLKNAAPEKSIKIEGGKTTKASTEAEPKKKRSRRKKAEPKPKEEQPKEETPKAEGEPSSAVFTKLFPPPSGLISDSINRYKEENPEIIKEEELPQAEATEAEVTERTLDEIWEFEANEKAPEEEPKKPRKQTPKVEEEPQIDETEHVIIEEPTPNPLAEENHLPT